MNTQGLEQLQHTIKGLFDNLDQRVWTLSCQHTSLVVRHEQRIKNLETKVRILTTLVVGMMFFILMILTTLVVVMMFFK
jgi:hypothetical protein